ncbi:MAG TPA: flagellar export chaperone FliS [Tepidisphaeraceae bacterium]|nr:flagellar export chaperone FliS [Tepidisphaeraceae bacterium]
MNSQVAHNSLRTKVMTATPEQLQLMLFDGAIRFAEQGKVALAKNDFEASYSALTKVQNIITELVSSLKHDIYPELCGKLASLYNYAYRNIVEANVHHRIEAVDDALKVIRYQRETWLMLIQQLQEKKGAEMEASLPAPPDNLPSEPTFSMQA